MTINPTLAAPSSRTFDKSFSMAGVTHVDVVLSFGDVQITSAAGDSIHATVTRKLGADAASSSFNEKWLAGDQLKIERSGTAVLISDRDSSKDDEGFQNHSSGRQQSLMLSLPASLMAAADLGAGNLTITGPLRDVAANLGAGNMTLRDAGTEGSPNAVEANVGFGKLTAAWNRTIAGSVKLNVGTGKLDAAFAPGQHATISANSGMGDVTVDSPGADVRRDSSFMSQSTHVSLNGGGDAYQLNTGTGSVTIGVSKS